MDKEIRKEVISILVDNQANVLTRVSSLFGRRGFNIDSLTVSATNDPKLSRITVVFTGTEQGLHQIITQTAKLEVVKKIFTLDKNDSIYRELLLLKVKADKTCLLYTSMCIRDSVCIYMYVTNINDDVWFVNTNFSGNRASVYPVAVKLQTFSQNLKMSVKSNGFENTGLFL